MKLTADYIKSIFPKRSIDSHKGDYGHTLIIAGSKQFTGAAVLCSMGCLRAESGLTSLAISESLYIPITKRLLPEIITITLPDKNYSISEKATKILLDYIIERKISSIALEFAKDYKLICVLKGYETVISDGEKIYLNTTGNPGMAVAGSGDVLTGMIAGLIGQTENLLDAACLGVYLHGLAGDLAAKEKTEISMLPTDLIEKIPDAIKNNYLKNNNLC